MARVVRGCSLVLSWGEGEGVVDKGGWGGWVLVASSDVMSAMLGEEAGCKGGIDKKKSFVISVSKIDKVLNFKTKYSIDDGIKEIINYLKKRKNLKPKLFGNHKIYYND